MSSFDDLIPAPTGRFDGIVRPYSAEDVAKLRGSLAIEHTIARKGALKLWELLKNEGLCPRARRHVGQSGDAAGPRRIEGDLPLGLAGRGGRQHRRRHVSRSVALSRQCGSRAVQADQQRAPARRPDRAFGRRRHPRLVRPDRRRCRGRLRRAAQLLRDHEGLYRRGRRRGALRGPARIGEEVRASWRQGADPDAGAYPQPRFGAASRRMSRACRR